MFIDKTKYYFCELLSKHASLSNKRKTDAKTAHKFEMGSKNYDDDVR